MLEYLLVPLIFVTITSYYISKILQGITVIGVCFVLELFVIQKVNVQKIVNQIKQTCYKSPNNMNAVPFKDRPISNNNHQHYNAMKQEKLHLTSGTNRSGRKENTGTSRIFSFFYNPV